MTDRSFSIRGQGQIGASCMSIGVRIVVILILVGTGLLANVLYTLRTDIGAIDRVRRLYSTAKGVSFGEEGLPQFGNVNPHEDWCPKATCKNSPLCQPCQRRFLVLVSTGRSGSTSLMSMLNLLPGVRISGENNNELRAMANAVETFVDATPTHMRRSPGEEEPADHAEWTDYDERNPWGHNYIPPGSFACPVQRMIEAINPPPVAEQLRGTAGMVYDTDIIGFKTIRFLEGWGDDERYPIEKPLRFFLDHFPCAKVVINIRSNTAELKESWRRTEAYMGNNGDLTLMTRRLKELADAFGPERAKLMNVNEWGSNPRKLDELAQWLGFQDCTYPDVLHSNDKGFWPDRKLIELGASCQYTGYHNSTTV